MKKEISPAMIIGAVALLAVLMFVMYRQFAGGNTTEGPTANQPPEYARQMQRGERPSQAPVSQPQAGGGAQGAGGGAGGR